MSLTFKTSKHAGKEAMTWVPNEHSENCQACQKKFGVLRLRHHCRKCGMLVCAKCSPDKDFVAGFKDKKVRVCKICISKKISYEMQKEKVKLFNSLAAF